MWVGKFVHRDRILAQVLWRGDERGLDVGTAGGRLAIGAAKRVPCGPSTGIDVWIAKDLSRNTLARAERNVALEGLRQRVEI